MPDSRPTRSLPLKAAVLAAGKQAGDHPDRAALGAESMVLQPLGDRRVIDYVVQNGLQLVSPDDLYIVVGYKREEVQAHLGPGYHYLPHVRLPILKDFNVTDFQSKASLHGGQELRQSVFNEIVR